MKSRSNYDTIISERKVQMKENRILMQYFEWYLKPEDKLWQKVSQEAKELKKVERASNENLHLVGSLWI